MSEFVTHVTEALAFFGPITARKMFGGYGIYHNNLMFGLVADDTLYLKADKKSAPLFRELSLEQFEYDKKGKPVKMSYYLAPDDVFEDPSAAHTWATRAYEAAARNRLKLKK